MTWQSEWKALSARIAGLAEASRFLVECFQAAQEDAHQVVERCIVPEARTVSALLRVFRQRNRRKLPPDAAAALDRFLQEGGGIVPDAWGPHDLQPITFIVLFRHQFEYLLRDAEASIPVVTERAFAHLQRLILADADTRKRWQRAFGRGEVACEKLGGAHLLLHCIWGFKIVGSGDARGAAEATDLVLQEPLNDLEAIERIAEGLVLTEWKLVLTPNQLKTKTDEAIEEAELYQGVLTGTQLRRTRYVVVVSEDQPVPPFERRIGDVLYKRISIRVMPSPASKMARLIMRSKRRPSR